MKFQFLVTCPNMVHWYPILTNIASQKKHPKKKHPMSHICSELMGDNMIIWWSMICAWLLWCYGSKYLTPGCGWLSCWACRIPSQLAVVGRPCRSMGNTCDLRGYIWVVLPVPCEDYGWLWFIQAYSDLVVIYLDESKWLQIWSTARVLCRSL